MASQESLLVRQFAEVSFKVWDEMWHVFQTFAIPEGQLAIDEIGDFVLKRLEQ